VEAVLKGVPIDNTSTARGFVGIAFCISDDPTRFEDLRASRDARATISSDVIYDWIGGEPRQRLTGGARRVKS
jgi:hypothetical protein